jgi:hypothetical protein
MERWLLEAALSAAFCSDFEESLNKEAAFQQNKQYSECISSSERLQLYLSEYTALPAHRTLYSILQRLLPFRAPADKSSDVTVNSAPYL